MNPCTPSLLLFLFLVDASIKSITARNFTNEIHFVISILPPIIRGNLGFKNLYWQGQQYAFLENPPFS